jgi:hypothetical protein
MSSTLQGGCVNPRLNFLRHTVLHAAGGCWRLLSESFYARVSTLILTETVDSEASLEIAYLHAQLSRHNPPILPYTNLLVCALFAVLCLCYLVALGDAAA